MDITFADFDLFERKELGENLMRYVKNNYKFYDEALVLSLNGKFGSGKTSFLKMWQGLLEKQGHSVIYINAWQSDFTGSPIVPITGELIRELKNLEPLKQDLQELGNMILRGSISMSSQLLHHSTGFDIKKFQQDFQGETQEDIIEAYIKQQKKLDKLRKLLNHIVEIQKEKPLIILVDELDRARPDYSVYFLETIKHIFSVKGICFVLAVDRKRMEQTVEKLFGKIDFNNYYRRFVSKEISLSLIDANHFGSFFDKISKPYLEIFHENNIIDIKEKFVFTVETLKLTPREAEQVCHIFLQFFSKNNSKLINEYWLVATLFLVAINVKDRENLFHKIGTGEITIMELEEEIKKYSSRSATKDEPTMWNFWVKIILASHLDNSIDSDEMEAVYRDIEDKLDDMSVPSIQHILRKMWERDVPCDRPFSDIYRRLQKLQFLLD